MTNVKVEDQPDSLANAGSDSAPAPDANLANSSADPVATAVSGEAAPQQQAVAKRPQKAVSLPDEAYPEGTTVIQDDFNDANPFNKEDWRVVLNAWAGFGLRALLILATGFSIYQYLSAREEGRVQRTLELVELWEQPEYQTAQTALKTRVGALNEKHQALLGADPSQAKLALYYDRIGIEAMEAEGGDMPIAEFSQHFDRIVYFLNRIAFCVEENLCSARVADAFFRDYAESFWRYFSGYVEAQRNAGSANFATQIEKYVYQDQASTTAVAETPPVAK